MMGDLSFLAGLDLLERLNELEAFRLRKPGEGGLLCLKAQTGLALLDR